jgi:hypothetical protein
MRREFLVPTSSSQLRVILREASNCDVEGPLPLCATGDSARRFQQDHCSREPLIPYGTLSLASSDLALSFPRSSIADTE